MLVQRMINWRRCMFLRRVFSLKPTRWQKLFSSLKKPWQTMYKKFFWPIVTHNERTKGLNAPNYTCPAKNNKVLTLNYGSATIKMLKNSPRVWSKEFRRFGFSTIVSTTNTVMLNSGMTWTRERLKHDWFIPKNNWRIFDPKVLEDFFHLQWQI